MSVRKVVIALSVVAAVIPSIGSANAKCTQNDDDKYFKCIVAEAHNSCDERLEPKRYLSCFQRAIIDSVVRSGMKGQADNWAEAEFACERNRFGKYNCNAPSGGYDYSCWRVNAGNIRECEGLDNRKCRTTACPTASCNKVCSASPP